MSNGEWILAVWVGTLISCVVMLLSGHMPTSAEWIAGVKDIATSAGVVVAAYVGIRGLSTWERQLKGNAEFEIARALARATLQVRDAIAIVRSPMMWAYEFPENYDPIKSDTSQRATARAHAYNNRWKPLTEAVLSFDLACLEAEALWGPEIKGACIEMRGCVGKLRHWLDDYLQFERDPQTAAFDASTAKEARAIIFSGSTNNVFTDEIETAVEGINALLRPHLRWLQSMKP